MSKLPPVPLHFRAWQEFSYPLSNFSTFGAGGEGKLVFFPRTADELEQTWVWACKAGCLPVMVGCGSNILFPDGEVETPIICARRIQGISFEDERLFAQCGASMAKVVQACKRYSLAGLEFAIDIPGTIGGSVMGNAGAYGSDLFATLEEFEYLDATGARKRATPKECQFGYRHSGIAIDSCILGATFHLHRDSIEEISKRITENQAHRRENQPHGAGSAGSIFKNPEGHSAWKLIDACGLKGFRMGQIGVSDKHANWVINYGGSTSAQIIALFEHLEEAVFQKSGIRLEREVRLRCF